MNGRRSKLGRAIPTMIASAAMIAEGCFNRGPQTPPVMSPTPVREALGSPAGVPLEAIPLAPTASSQGAPEPFIDMVMVDAPVRLVLQRLAELGRFDLIIPSNITNTISVQYVHVPISMALADVLRRSGLRIGSSASATPALPFDTVTVFYQLPANVDSMSADAIMRRYGVSRAIADLIVKSRRP